MSRTEEIFIPALKNKKVPILTLDNKWHQLMAGSLSDKNFRKLESELNDLMKKQGKANTELKKLKQIKRRLMDEIVLYADDASSGRSKKAEKKMEENKLLINECNQKIEECEDDLIELPGEIEKINNQLMVMTMEICYNTIKKNKEEIAEAEEWINNTRTELKERLVKQQEQVEMNQYIYNYMHDIFGADVINIFDMEYMKRENKE